MERNKKDIKINFGHPYTYMHTYIYEPTNNVCPNTWAFICTDQINMWQEYEEYYFKNSQGFCDYTCDHATWPTIKIGTQWYFSLIEDNGII